jgi:diguanylate cyclase (GGDEF)-like protein
MPTGDVFVIDDNPNNLALLTGILRQAGYRVRAANDGRRALSMVKALKPELIMLDITMPELDGFEVCSRLKADEELSDVPVIFISALDDVLDKVTAFRVGGVDYVTKPFQAEEVLARVETQLGLARLRDELERKNRELERMNHILQSLSFLDPLTGVANRRSFDTVLGQEWSRAGRDDTVVSLIFADIDHFKLFNDTYGHQQGDTCLGLVATAIAGACQRAGDCAARYGGEEFAVILPGTDAAGAQHIAECARARVEELGIAHKASPIGVVTVSIGTATLVPCDGVTGADLVAAADRALYRAKNEGRNRVLGNDER